MRTADPMPGLRVEISQDMATGSPDVGATDTLRACGLCRRRVTHYPCFHIRPWLMQLSSLFELVSSNWPGS